MVFPTRVELNIYREYFACFENSLSWEQLLQKKWGESKCIAFLIDLISELQETVLFPAITFICSSAMEDVIRHGSMSDMKIISKWTVLITK